MEFLVTASLVFAFLTFFFLFRMLGCIRRRRIIRAGGSCLSCVVSAALAGAGGMMMLSYLSYDRLIEEQLVSRIEFSRISAEEFQARLMIQGSDDQFFVLRGNEWQMDARIVTWKPPLTVLGLDPIYQLDRLSGRYSDIGREQSEVRTVHALAAAPPADIWQFARRFPRLLAGIDAHYGTATFVPMADGALFEVSLSRDALIARPANANARDAIGAWYGN